MTKVAYLPGAMRDPRQVLERVAREDGLEGVIVVSFVREGGEVITRIAQSSMAEMQISYAATTLLDYAINGDKWESMDERN
jgi:hypothetical protein